MVRCGQTHLRSLESFDTAWLSSYRARWVGYKMALMDCPIVFHFERIIYGRGFAASVEVVGRALGVLEDEDLWIHGVQPGAIAASGSSLAEVLDEFKKQFATILFDMADGASDFKSFSVDVNRFFYAVDAEDEQRWLKAPRTRRHASHPFSTLPPALTPMIPSILVKQIEQRRLDPALNKLDEIGLALAG